MKKIILTLTLFGLLISARAVGDPQAWVKITVTPRCGCTNEVPFLGGIAFEKGWFPTGVHRPPASTGISPVSITNLSGSSGGTVAQTNTWVHFDADCNKRMDVYGQMHDWVVGSATGFYTNPLNGITFTITSNIVWTAAADPHGHKRLFGQLGCDVAARVVGSDSGITLETDAMGVWTTICTQGRIDWGRFWSDLDKDKKAAVWYLDRRFGDTIYSWACDINNGVADGIVYSWKLSTYPKYGPKFWDTEENFFNEPNH